MLDDLERQCRFTAFGTPLVNQAGNGVHLYHIPTGLSVKSECERTQRKNRQAALIKLQQLLESESK